MTKRYFFSHILFVLFCFLLKANIFAQTNPDIGEKKYIATDLMELFDEASKEWIEAQQFDFLQKVRVNDKPLSKFTGYIIAEKNGKKGLLNLEGELVLPIAYKNIQYQTERDDLVSIWKVENELGLIGLLSHERDTIIPIDCERIWFDKKEEDYNAEIKGKQFTYNLYGELIGDPKQLYPQIGAVNGRPIYRAKYAGKWGLMLVTGELLLPFEYTDVSAFYDKPDLYKVEHPEKGIALLNNAFEVVFPFSKYADLQHSKIVLEKLGEWPAPILFKREAADTRFSRINMEGQVLSSPSFLNPASLIVVDSVVFEVPGRNQLLIKNLDGSLIVKDTLKHCFEMSTSLSNRSALREFNYRVLMNAENKCAVIDCTNQKIITPFMFDRVYDDVGDYEHPIRFFCGKLNGKYVIFDLDGNFLTKKEFTEVYRYSKVFFKVPNLKKVAEKYNYLSFGMKDEKGNYYVIANDKLIKVK